MGLKQLEAAILAETRAVAKNNKIRQKDIMEWQTGKGLKAQDGEVLYYLPDLAVSVAVKLPAEKRANNGLHATESSADAISSTDSGA